MQCKNASGATLVAILEKIRVSVQNLQPVKKTPVIGVIVRFASGNA